MEQTQRFEHRAAELARVIRQGGGRRVVTVAVDDGEGGWHVARTPASGRGAAAELTESISEALESPRAWLLVHTPTPLWHLDDESGARRRYVLVHGYRCGAGAVVPAEAREVRRVSPELGDAAGRFVCRHRAAPPLEI